MSKKLPNTPDCKHSDAELAEIVSAADAARESGPREKKVVGKLQVIGAALISLALALTGCSKKEKAEGLERQIAGCKGKAYASEFMESASKRDKRCNNLVTIHGREKGTQFEDPKIPGLGKRVCGDNAKWYYRVGGELNQARMGTTDPGRRDQCRAAVEGVEERGRGSKEKASSFDD